MNTLIKATRIIESDLGLQLIFGIMLFLLIILAFSFFRRFVNGISINPSEGHSLGIICKNTGKVFPITTNNIYIEPNKHDKLGSRQEILIRCICGEIHGFDVPVRYIDDIHKKR